MGYAIIIHGEKHTRSGGLHPAYKNRLDKTIDYSRSHPGLEMIILTGGKTRRKCQSEAEAGREYLDGKVNAHLILEDRAKTTADNVVYSKKMMRPKDFERVIVITSRARMMRAKYLYARLWPEAKKKLEFVSSEDTYTVLRYVVEAVSLVGAMIDPRGD